LAATIPTENVVVDAGFATARFNMVEQQIRPWNVLDTAILDLLESMRREEFVPEAHKSLAYDFRRNPAQPDSTGRELPALRPNQ